MKRPLLIGLLLVAVIAAVVLWMLDAIGPGTGDGKTAKEGSQPNPGESRTTHALSPEGLPLVQMKPVKYEIDYNARSRELENPPYEFRGTPGTGYVTDRQGRVLMESSKEFAICGVAVSPDKKRVLVEGGDGKSLILEPLTNQKTVPPFRPPGSNLFPFGWYWIGPNTLFGVTGVQALDKNGEPVKHDDNVAQSKLYTFDVITERLSEVVMPSAVTLPRVGISEFMSDGHIHLWDDISVEGKDPDLGWFKIEVPQ